MSTDKSLRDLFTLLDEIFDKQGEAEVLVLELADAIRQGRAPAPGKPARKASGPKSSTRSTRSSSSTSSPASTRSSRTSPAPRKNAPRESAETIGSQVRALIALQKPGDVVLRSELCKAVASGRAETATASATIVRLCEQGQLERIEPGKYKVLRAGGAA